MCAVFCRFVVQLYFEYPKIITFIKTCDTSYFCRGQNTLKLNLSVSAAVVFLVIIGVALTLTTFAAVSTSQNLSSSGTVTTSANLGVYSNSACTTVLSSINWGTLTPGTSYTQTVYVKNTGNGLSLTLSMNATNWSPVGANGPMSLSWNQEGTRLTPGQSVAATLTLVVSSSISDVTNFSVQINITGTN